MATTLRVAMTLEQCWHRVPGGTAVSAMSSAGALGHLTGITIVGVAARHPRPPAKDWLPPVEVFQLPLPRLLLYQTWHRLRRPRVELATDRVDVIHATTLALPPRSAPLVVTMHDLAFLTRPQHFTRRGLAFFRRGLALALEEADAVVCPSAATMRDCLDVGFDAARLRVVPWGADAGPASDADVASTRRRFGLERPYALWVGTIEPRKNLAGLIDAMARLEWPVDLVIAGAPGWHEDINARVAARPDRIRVITELSRRDLGPLYAGAVVFCFPSLQEGFGLPVLEAMAQGTPVVTARGTATEEVGADAAVLVDPGDAGSIASGIGRVLDDPALQEKLSVAGRARSAEFTWERTARELASVYREVAA